MLIIGPMFEFSDFGFCISDLSCWFRLCFSGFSVLFLSLGFYILHLRFAEIDVTYTP